jgi:hypothetical protein
MEKQLENDVFKQMDENNKKFKEFIDSDLETKKRFIEMKKQLEKHPYGFEYTLLGDGRVSVTELERLRYTKSKPLRFSGEDDEGYPLNIENFTQCIKEGGKFTQIDMFGNTETVTKRELKQFINEYYQY